MSRSGWLILGAIFVVIFGGAAAVLAMMLVREAEPPPERPPMERRQEVPVAPDLAGAPRSAPMPESPPTSNPMSSDAAMQRHVEALEDEVQRLREQLAEERSKR